MNIIEEIKKKAKARKVRIILPEINDERVKKAAIQIMEEGIAQIIMIGDPQQIKEVHKDIIALNPEEDSNMEEYIEEYCELRKHRGMTSDRARTIMKNPLFYTAMLVRKGVADGFVAGASCPTADVIRPAIHIIGTKKGISIVSSFSIMVLPHTRLNEDGVFFFADTGVNPEPTPEQLADIAICAGDNYRVLMNKEPYIAMISFSTKGSASHPLVDKVKEATKIAIEKRPDLNIDGELQLDAAIIPEIAARKCKDSKVAGRANVLIFPDLNCANTCYKIVERMAGAGAFGPIFQGLNKPASDLSRGCSSEDIVNITSIVAVQATSNDT